MIYREIIRRNGVRTERLVDGLTGRTVTADPVPKRAADPWTEHWSSSMGARTKQHGLEIAARCRAAGLEAKFQFGDRGPLRVTSRRNQKRLLKVANADVGPMVNWDDV